MKVKTKKDGAEFVMLDEEGTEIGRGDSEEELHEAYKEEFGEEVDLITPEPDSEPKQEEPKPEVVPQESNVVPLAALRDERGKRQDLEQQVDANDVRFQAVEAQLSEIAAALQGLTQKPEEVASDGFSFDNEDTTDDVVTKQDLQAAISQMAEMMSNSQKVALADNKLSQLSSMEKPEGYLLSPAQIVEDVRPVLASDPALMAHIADSPDMNEPLQSMYKYVLMQRAMNSPETFPSMVGGAPAAPPVPATPAPVAAPTLENDLTAAQEANKKLEAIATGNLVHPSMASGGDEGGNLTDPVDGLLARLQQLAAKDSDEFADALVKLKKDSPELLNSLEARMAELEEG